MKPTLWNAVSTRSRSLSRTTHIYAMCHTSTCVWCTPSSRPRSPSRWCCLLLVLLQPGQSIYNTIQSNAKSLRFETPVCPAHASSKQTSPPPLLPWWCGNAAPEVQTLRRSNVAPDILTSQRPNPRCRCRQFVAAICRCPNTQTLGLANGK